MCEQAQGTTPQDTSSLRLENHRLALYVPYLSYFEKACFYLQNQVKTIIEQACKQDNQASVF